jgi:hypothetical protein
MRYEIRIEGRLDRGWTTWFGGLKITPEPDGVTVMAGTVADQAALHGVLARIRDLGLTLVSVRRIDPHGHDAPPREAHAGP